MKKIPRRPVFLSFFFPCSCIVFPFKTSPPDLKKTPPHLDLPPDKRYNERKQSAVGGMNYVQNFYR